jgi:hypothetical protein
MSYEQPLNQLMHCMVALPPWQLPSAAEAATNLQLMHVPWDIIDDSWPLRYSRRQSVMVTLEAALVYVCREYQYVDSGHVLRTGRTQYAY